MKTERTFWSPQRMWTFSTILAIIVTRFSYESDLFLTLAFIFFQTDPGGLLYSFSFFFPSSLSRRSFGLFAGRDSRYAIVQHVSPTKPRTTAFSFCPIDVDGSTFNCLKMEEDETESNPSNLQCLFFDEDYSDEKNSNELSLLLDRRGNVVSVLKSLRRALIINRGEVVLGEPVFIPDITAGFENANQTFYSWRGIEKCKDIFNFFDSDKDGRMTYEDFQVFAEVTKQTDLLNCSWNSNSEAWLNYMWDGHGACFDNAIGGFITVIHFTNFQYSRERIFSLEKALIELGFPLLTRRLYRWHKAKTAFSKIDLENFTAMEMTEEQILKLEAEGEDVPTTDFTPRESGMIPVTEFQLLMADSGEMVTGFQATEILMRYYMWVDVMEELLEHANRKNMFAVVKLSTAIAGNTKLVFRDHFLAWFSSESPLRYLWKTEYFLVKLKTSAQRFLRNAAKVSEIVMKHISGLFGRAVLSERILEPLKSEEGRIHANFDVGGEMPDDDSGFSITVALRNEKNPTEEVPLLHFKKDVGTVIFVDFVFRATVTEEAVNECKVLVTKVLTEHFLTELSKIPYFYTWSVTTPLNELDRVRVLRITILLKSQCSLDKVLTRLGTGCKLYDIVRSFRLQLSFSLPLTDIFDSSRTNLNEKLFVSGSFESIFSRFLIAKVLEELLISIEESISEAKANRQEKARDAELAQKRTWVFNPDLRNPLIIPDPEKPYETDNQLLVQEHTLLSWVRWMWKGWTCLKGTKAMILEFSWESLYEMSFGNKYIKDRLPSWFRSQYLTESGAVTRWARAAVKTFADELKAISNRIIEQQIKDKQRNDQRLAKWMKSTLYMEKLKTLEKLKELGMASKDLDGLLDEDVDPASLSPSERLFRARAQQARDDTLLLEAYSSCRKSLLGPQAICIQSGNNSVYMNFQGIDLFELLPEWPPKEM